MFINRQMDRQFIGYTIGLLSNKSSKPQNDCTEVKHMKGCVLSHILFYIKF